MKEKLKENQIKTTIRIDKTTHEKLKEFSKRKKMSQSDYIAFLINGQTDRFLLIRDVKHYEGGDISLNLSITADTTAQLGGIDSGRDLLCNRKNDK